MPVVLDLPTTLEEVLVAIGDEMWRWAFIEGLFRVDVDGQPGIMQTRITAESKIRVWKPDVIRCPRCNGRIKYRPCPCPAPEGADPVAYELQRDWMNKELARVEARRRGIMTAHSRVGLLLVDELEQAAQDRIWKPDE